MISAGVLHDTDNSGLMSVPVAVVLSDCSRPLGGSTDAQG